MAEEEQVFIGCGDHWSRCVANNPCDTCPSKPENRVAAEMLAKLSQHEKAKLSAAVLTEVSNLNRMLNGAGDGRNGYEGVLARLKLIEARDKWQQTSTDKWTSRILVIISLLIAGAALVSSLAG